MYQTLFYFGMTLYMFRTSFRSSSGVQDCTHNSRYYCLLASKQIAVSVWQMPVAVCTVLNSWWGTERPSETCRVSFQNKIKFDTLVHLVGFTTEIILRCTALWTSNLSEPNVHLWDALSLPRLWWMRTSGTTATQYICYVGIITSELCLSISTIGTVSWSLLQPQYQVTRKKIKTLSSHLAMKMYTGGWN